jgi:hypothetical protein
VRRPRRLAYWLQAALPDDVEEAAERQRDQREFTMSQSLDGVWFVRLTLDPISGEVVSNELRRLETARGSTRELSLRAEVRLSTRRTSAQEALLHRNARLTCGVDEYSLGVSPLTQRS